MITSKKCPQQPHARKFSLLSSAIPLQNTSQKHLHKETEDFLNINNEENIQTMKKKKKGPEDEFEGEKSKLLYKI